jgi:hypothetical protein
MFRVIEERDQQTYRNCDRIFLNNLLVIKNDDELRNIRIKNRIRDLISDIGLRENVGPEVSDRLSSTVDGVVDRISTAVDGVGKYLEKMESNLGINSEIFEEDSIRIDFQTLLCKLLAGRNVRDEKYTTKMIEIYINNINIDLTSPKYNSFRTVYQFCDVDSMLQNLGADVRQVAVGFKKVYEVSKLVKNSRSIKRDARIEAVCIVQDSHDSLDTPRYMHTMHTKKGDSTLNLQLYTLGGFTGRSKHISMNEEMEGCLYISSNYYIDDEVKVRGRKITVRSVVIRERWITMDDTINVTFNNIIDIARNGAVMIETKGSSHELIPFVVENGGLKGDKGTRVLRIHMFSTCVDMLDYVTSLSIRQLASASRQIDNSMSGLMRNEMMVGYSINMHSSMGHLYPSNLLKSLYILMNVGEPRLNNMRSIQSLLLRGGHSDVITPALTGLVVNGITKEASKNTYYNSIISMLVSAQVVFNMVTAPMRVEDIVRGDFTSEMLYATLVNAHKVDSFVCTWDDIITSKMKEEWRRAKHGFYATTSNRGVRDVSYHVNQKSEWIMCTLRFIQAMSTCDQDAADRYMLSLIYDQEKILQ